MRTLFLGLLTAGAIGLGAGSALADLTPADQAFANQAASSSMTEIQLAQIAQQRATSSDVRQLARRMIADHNAASQDLTGIADQLGLTLPEQPDRSAQAMIQRLRGTTGANFDQAFIQLVVRYHRQDLAAFRREAQSGQDPDLKAFAQHNLLMIQQHLQLAQSLNQPG
jgi:putative membrane protein